MAEKRVEALVHVIKLKDIHIEYERCKFNQSMAIVAKKQIANLTKFSILKDPASSSLECNRW